MLFHSSRVHGAHLIELEAHRDTRGSFARAWCQREFQRQGLVDCLAQINFSHNHEKGTLRGMHLQADPFAEAKVVFCTKGAIYDVVLDLRVGSTTYLGWDAFHLTAENQRAAYIPPGCAHGFQTLEDETHILYLISEFYAPGHAGGVRHDDPAFGIEWPLAVTSISEADRTWPDYRLDS
jgi:dTDP-4-dehydrorhamnose 3,5-epimerase